MVFIDKIKYVSFFNDTGVEIPPFAPVKITGATVQLDEMIYSIGIGSQIDVDIQEPGAWLFNSILPVADQEYGTGTRDMPCQARVYQPSTDFPSGTIVGPLGNLRLGELGSCFRILCKDPTNPHVEANHGIYIVEPYHGKADVRIGKTLAPIPGRVGLQLSFREVEVYNVDTNDQLVDWSDAEGMGTVQAGNMSIDPIQTDTWVELTRIGNKWLAEEICQ